MALRFIDSMAHYGTSAMVIRKWTNQNLVTFQSSGGRRNGAFLDYTGGALLKTLTHQVRYIQGAAMAVRGGGQGMVVAHAGKVVAALQIESDNTLSVRGGGAGEVIGTMATAVPDIGAWHYYEFDCQVASSGTKIQITASVSLDSNLVINGAVGTTAINPADLLTGNADVNQIGFSGAAIFSVMDYYCTDTNATDINSHATTNTGMLGDVEIDAVFPATDVTTNWGKFGGIGTGSHFNAINEVPPDDDTSYIFSTATGSSETFNYQSIAAFTGTLIGAQYLLCAKKTAEGLRTIALTVGGTNVKTVEFIGTANYLADYYIYYIAPLDSDNGVAWTPTVFNTEAFGVTLLA